MNLLFNAADKLAENYARRLAEPCRVDTPLLAEIDSHVIGIANLRLLSAVFYSELYAELTELFVEEGYRRCGVGQALIAFSEQMALEAGASEILILTGFYNHAAQALYRASGYRHYAIALEKKLG